MVALWIPLFVTVGQVAAQQIAQEPVLVRYATSTVGRQVTIILDGKQRKTTFAGKLGFQDATSRWTTVCGEVRRPINQGQFFTVQPTSSKTLGGNVAKAGNIVAKFFETAKSPDECAGLQLAVWEAVEDGDAQPDYTAGHFQAKANTKVLDLAKQYYQAIGQDSDVLYLMQVGGPRGGGPGGGGPGGPGGGGQGQFGGPGGISGR